MEQQNGRMCTACRRYLIRQEHTHTQSTTICDIQKTLNDDGLLDDGKSIRRFRFPYSSLFRCPKYPPGHLRVVHILLAHQTIEWWPQNYKAAIYTLWSIRREISLPSNSLHCFSVVHCGEISETMATQEGSEVFSRQVEGLHIVSRPRESVSIKDPNWKQQYASLSLLLHCVVHSHWLL